MVTVALTANLTAKPGDDSQFGRTVPDAGFPLTRRDARVYTD